MPPDNWMLMAHVGIAAAIMMALLWALHFPLKDAGLVDVGWSFGLGASAVYYAFMADGDIQRRVIIALLAAFWGLRLAAHLLFDRVIPPGEDGRYAMLREKLGPKFGMLMLPFFEFQALLVVALSLPFLLASVAERPLAITDFLGVGVWIVGIVGETIADNQLRRFKRKPDTKGKTCRDGLWRYSRHPNYFFEWLMWVGYALIALAAPMGWLGLTAPALILFFVLKVTGIPPTEARAIRSRGDDYRRYQRETSAFFPWFPRKEPA